MSPLPPTQILDHPNGGDALASGSESEGAWRSVAGGWRQLYGSFARRGFSVESHQFTPSVDLDWQASFHPDSLEICLNLEGDGHLMPASGPSVTIGPGVLALYSTGPEIASAVRPMGQKHEFITFELSRDYLRAFLSGSEHHLLPLFRKFLMSQSLDAAPVVLRALTPVQQALARQMDEPPVLRAGHGLWYQAKLLELLPALAFAETRDEKEMFCERQKRLAQERSEKVKRILAENLREPPSLEGHLGRMVGCSPFYLSRIFSQEVGATIQNFLKNLRMERATELLRTGRHNVTETALEVGYTSLSHFSKVFHEHTGCCPGLYPHGATFQPPRRPKTRAKAAPESAD